MSAVQAESASARDGMARAGSSSCCVKANRSVFPHTLAPIGSEGAVAGLQDFSRGLGLVLGPVAVGTVIDLFRAS
jgi:hypothetical protein